MEDTKLCKYCSEVKPFSAFFVKRGNKKTGRFYKCKQCVSREFSLLPRSRRDQHIQNTKDANQRLVDYVITGYGNSCNCCGETIRAFLTLDHVNGRGTHTKTDISRKRHYRDARDRGFPPDYQVLCWNCNWAKGCLGQCPHKLQSEKAA